MTIFKLATFLMLSLCFNVGYSQEKKPFISRFYLHGSTFLEYNLIGDKSTIDYAEFQDGKDAFTLNNDFDSLRSSTHFDVHQQRFEVGLLYNLTSNPDKRFSHHIGIRYSGQEQFQISNQVGTSESQNVDSVEIQSNGIKLPVNLVTSIQETETYTAKSNLVGLNYMLSYHLNKRWLINATVSASYYIVRMATGYVTRTTIYNFEPSVYPTNLSYGIDQFGQKLGIHLGRIGASISPMILLNAEEKRRDGKDFRCRYYFGLQMGFGAIVGKVNTANYYNTDFLFGASLLVQPFKLRFCSRI